VDRLPAIPSYELSGLVAHVAPDVDDIEVGEEVFALTPFDRDGVAADTPWFRPLCSRRDQ
jgi:NADPH:quinone reductase-like Zn-dependent oxidoreductase